MTAAPITPAEIGMIFGLSESEIRAAAKWAPTAEDAIATIAAALYEQRAIGRRWDLVMGGGSRWATPFVRR